jgi:hypothetical protein
VDKEVLLPTFSSIPQEQYYRKKSEQPEAEGRMLKGEVSEHPLLFVRNPSPF